MITPDRFLRPALAAALGALPCACQGPTDGTLTVRYELGSGDMDACAEFDVMRVRATLGQDDYVEETDCGQEVVFTNVDAGVWSIRVEALDAEGITVMDNGDKEKIEIVGGRDDDYEAMLTATPAKIHVRWSIVLDDFPIQCQNAENAITSFEAVAWDMGSPLLESAPIACDATPTAGTYHLIPDPDRRITGNRLSEVTVQALDATNADSGPRVRFILGNPPGPGRMLYFTVRCVASTDACEGVSEPPYQTP